MEGHVLGETLAETFFPNEEVLFRATLFKEHILEPFFLVAFFGGTPAGHFWG